MSLENRGISLEGTTEKTNSQEEGLLSNFLGPLMKFGSSLMKNVLTLLSKSVLISLGLMTAALATFYRSCGTKVEMQSSAEYFFSMSKSNNTHGTAIELRKRRFIFILSG